MKEIKIYYNWKDDVITINKERVFLNVHIKHYEDSPWGQQTYFDENGVIVLKECTDWLFLVKIKDLIFVASIDDSYTYEEGDGLAVEEVYSLGENRFIWDEIEGTSLEDDYYNVLNEKESLIYHEYMY